MHCTAVVGSRNSDRRAIVRRQETSRLPPATPGQDRSSRPRMSFADQFDSPDTRAASARCDASTAPAWRCWSTPTRRPPRWRSPGPTRHRLSAPRGGRAWRGERGDEQPDGHLARTVVRKVWTIRGETWPMANCTTTMVIANASVVNETIETPIVSTIATATSGPASSIGEQLVKAAGRALQHRCEAEAETIWPLPLRPGRSAVTSRVGFPDARTPPRPRRHDLGHLCVLPASDRHLHEWITEGGSFDTFSAHHFPSR